MIQLLLHLIGDYTLQSHWMAINKTKAFWSAFCHATVYSLPFLLVGSWLAVFVIWSTHLLIDRYRLARYVVWAKNRLLGPWLGSEPDVLDVGEAEHTAWWLAAEHVSWETARTLVTPRTRLRGWLYGC